MYAHSGGPFYKLVPRDMTQSITASPICSKQNEALSRKHKAAAAATAGSTSRPQSLSSPPISPHKHKKTNKRKTLEDKEATRPKGQSQSAYMTKKKLKMTAA